MKNKEIRNALNETYKAIRKYLVLCGWIEGDLYQQSIQNNGNTIGYVTDPINGLVHRIDLAYIIQNERDYIKILQNDKKFWNEDFQDPCEYPLDGKNE